MPTVFIPPQIRSLVEERQFVQAEGTTIRRIIDDLDRRYPGVKDRLCQDDELRPDIAVAVDGNLSALGLLQRVEQNAEVHFLPSIGGG